MASVFVIGRRHGTFKLIAIYLVFVAIASVALTTLRRTDGDRLVYQTAALCAFDGDRIYRADDQAAFSYPPFMMTVYMPFARLPQQWARIAWNAVNFCLLGAIIVMICRLVWPAIEPGHSWSKPPLWLSFAISGVMAARFVVSQIIEYQGHDLFIFFFVMLAISAWAADANGRAGGWAGLAAACKATPLLFLPVFVWQRRWRAVTALLLVCAVATLLPDLLFPRREGGLWVVSWYDTFVSKVSISAAPEALGAWHSWNSLNQSLSGTLHRIFTWVDQPTEEVWNACLLALGPRALAGLMLAVKLGVVGVLLFCAWPTRLRGLAAPERAFCIMGQGSAVLCGMLLLSPMSRHATLLFSFGAISFCVADFIHRRRDWVVGAWLIVAFFGCSLTSNDIIGQTGYRYVQVYGQLTWCAMGFLLTSSYIVYGRAKAARVQTTDTSLSPAATTSESRLAA